MLKLTNRLLQWLQSIQKPLAGLFRHLVWPKNEEVMLLGSPSFKLVVSAYTNCTLVHSTWNTRNLKNENLELNAAVLMV